MLFQRKSLSSYQVRILFKNNFTVNFDFKKKFYLSQTDAWYISNPYSLQLFVYIYFDDFFYVFWRCTWGTLNEGDEIVSISSKLVRRMTRVDCVKALKGKTKCHLPCSSHLFCPVYFSFSLSDIHKTVHISFLDRHI